MNVVRTQFSVAGKFLEIYVAGCNRTHKCTGTCHNKELWSFDAGADWGSFTSYIDEKMVEFGDIIDLLVVTGGEPLDQDEDELVDLLSYLNTLDRPVCLFTSYSFKNVPDRVKALVRYVKCEPFLVDWEGSKDVGLFTLASSNQILYKKEELGLWSCI